MRLLIKIFSLSFLSLVIAFSCYAACSTDKAKNAEETINGIKNWDDLDEHFAKFHSCDDGAIAEGYSDVISVLLTKKWKELNSLQIDDKFKEFIVSHIDNTWQESKIISASNNVNDYCKDNIREICEAIITLSNSFSKL